MKNNVLNTNIAQRREFVLFFIVDDAIFYVKISN